MGDDMHTWSRACVPQPPPLTSPPPQEEQCLAQPVPSPPVPISGTDPQEELGCGDALNLGRLFQF